MANHGLTGELVLRESFSVAEGAIKTVPAAATSFSIELDAADGDNVTAKADTATVADATETSAVGMKSVCLYIDPGAAATAKLQISPVDSGALWMDVTSGSVANDPVDLKSTSVLTICARRIRVVTVAGAPTFNLVMQSV